MISSRRAQIINTSGRQVANFKVQKAEKLKAVSRKDAQAQRKSRAMLF
jgi:hypothetical protein